MKRYELKPISEAPKYKRILLYWEKLDHFEDGSLYEKDKSGAFSHELFDGERLDSEPSHWIEIPYMCKR